MSDVATALISAFAVVLGGSVTGVFALLAQRNARKADRERWEREASERSRTRFHDTRLSAYAEFLGQASNAHGFLLHQAIQRHGQQPNSDALSAMKTTLGGPSVEHPEFNSDAARQMVRRQTMVTLLAGTAETRDAATGLVDAVLAVAAIASDDPDWNAKTMANVAQVGEAQQRFMKAAGTELPS